MIKSIIILSLLFSIIIDCCSQNDQTSNFIPKGYLEYKKHFADLNNDGEEDCVLIIKKTDTTEIVINRFDNKVDRNRRGIIVLFKTDNSFQLADKNYECFSSENEDGGVYFPPELSIEFERGNLVFNYNHGRYGYWRYIFRFQNSNFMLIGYDSSNNYGPVIDQETSINFLTKKKLIRKNTNVNAESGDEVFKETRSNIKIDSLIKLSEIKHFEELKIYNY